MNSPCVDVAESLDVAGVLSSSEEVKYSTMPDNLVPCISVHDTGGFDPDVGVDYYKPTIQVRVRNSTYINAYELAESVMNYLHTLNEVTINSTRYVAVWAMGDVIHLGRDESNSHLLSLNFRIHRTNV